MRLEKKVVLITGASGGIGESLALSFAQEGTDLILWDIIEPKIALLDKIKNFSREVLFQKVDITKMEEVGKAMGENCEKLKRLDVLINNAGITRDNLLLRMSEEDWETVMKVNLKGTFNCIKTASKFMMRQKYGKIINIASVIGLIGNIGQSNYAASKAGILGLTKSAARELARFKINVNAIAPGYIDTPMTQKLPLKVKEEMLKNIPLGRFGKPDDVAKTAIFLASEESSYLTGQVIKVDGGLVM
ncbi:MAG: 3-oxoacyl-ACP reductase [bacterium (Candidatus Ratteibacteria) CG_4_10_14_3_um_filter_41_18]|uniref:3-oxoacyl-[acyl-carrier-protein] reductase n=4 Tax=Candidatus Ratteibacteria TaxID=2979319 RepID=A0A2M7YE58_9BACT|nr:MAG: 3-oxoacyl-ACP reductase [bacterium (Candidatus Ratteibacteria) CG01_land_8_20_14_3_00_40_19]PIW33049.1 MAG: 3-oxoacyl-ACP reductase [bacterium (Candidatus Ratteibacteria) CG15_BIG_FIL_POST_REV_8_21_14_020_41_12]PIX76693.1 MAG: 3-oxoacyl-ACP reductase [bacterium (Candidatus Ratteibacteria) CG_4_10_14_3_um_filter_41_18]PJA61275.1 MAG: 3-oxoacyl-ACP reductase [bacterium (Candidatus Ratteibacteria) CG_4_9_14_3_um_filter_41_21]HCG76371.1 3-oxoacyl-ACP reductase [bacterium]